MAELSFNLPGSQTIRCLNDRLEVIHAGTLAKVIAAVSIERIEISTTSSPSHWFRIYLKDSTVFELHTAEPISKSGSPLSGLFDLLHNWSKAYHFAIREPPPQSEGSVSSNEEDSYGINLDSAKRSKRKPLPAPVIKTLHIGPPTKRMSSPSPDPSDLDLRTINGNAATSSHQPLPLQQGPEKVVKKRRLRKKVAEEDEEPLPPKKRRGKKTKVDEAANASTSLNNEAPPFLGTLSHLPTPPSVSSSFVKAPVASASLLNGVDHKVPSEAQTPTTTAMTNGQNTSARRKRPRATERTNLTIAYKADKRASQPTGVRDTPMPAEVTVPATAVPSSSTPPINLAAMENARPRKRFKPDEPIPVSLAVPPPTAMQIPPVDIPRHPSLPMPFTIPMPQLPRVDFIGMEQKMELVFREMRAVSKSLEKLGVHDVEGTVSNDKAHELLSQMAALRNELQDERNTNLELRSRIVNLEAQLTETKSLLYHTTVERERLSGFEDLLKVSRQDAETAREMWLVTDGENRKLQSRIRDLELKISPGGGANGREQSSTRDFFGRSEQSWEGGGDSASEGLGSAVPKIVEDTEHKSIPESVPTSSHPTDAGDGATARDDEDTPVRPQIANLRKGSAAWNGSEDMEESEG
ncbi:hypothetical protein BT69DRAFT_1122962 [Atractiella rhizophila]|nr:hypothetical protein BT69DRAFT_1122962 [Atractiella rhizophila]